MGLAEEGDQMKKDDEEEKVVRYTIKVDGKQTGSERLVADCGVRIKVHQVTKGDVDNPDEQVCTPLNTSPPRAWPEEPDTTNLPLPDTQEKTKATKKNRKKAKTSPKKKKNDGSPEFSGTQLNSQLYKTELCRSWRYAGSCRYLSKCKFAHGLPDLRPVQRSRKYKTQLCNKWNSFGYCPYGDRCQFLHGIPMGVPNIPPPYTPPRKMPMQIIQSAPMIPYIPYNSIPFLMSPSIPSPPQYTQSEKMGMKNCMMTSPPFLTVNPIAPVEVEAEYPLHINTERTAAEVAAYDEIHDIDTQIESLEDAKLKIMLAKTENLMYQTIRSPPPKISSPLICLKGNPELLPLTQSAQYNVQQQENYDTSHNDQVPYQDTDAEREIVLTINEGKRYATNFVPREE